MPASEASQRACPAFGPENSGRASQTLGDTSCSDSVRPLTSPPSLWTTLSVSRRTSFD